ncbi:MAG: cysteine desulfurase family protein [Candidatus Acidiferrales bacterium]
MRVYLDHNATTPVDPAVLDAMQPFFSDAYGNASSIHSAGQRARAAVDASRDSVARLIGAKPSEIVFTSGGTEADNLAVFGSIESARSASSARPHLITTAIEHHAVLNAAQYAAKKGIDVTFVPVSASGVVDAEKVRAALRPETFLISVMHANNELGTIQPIEEIARVAAEADVYFHADAVQSAGKLPLNVKNLGVDLLTLSAHKIYGPKGVGALCVRAGTPIAPQMFGGHHERDRRPGTENVPAIVGFGRAAELAAKHLASDDESTRMAQLRDKFEHEILASVPGTRVNGDPHRRVANTTNLSFDGIAGEAFVIALDLLGISVSTGAACSSGAIEPSHVLRAIGLTDDQAESSIRFSLGRHTTAAEIDYVIATVKATVERMRNVSPAHRTPASLR